MRTKLKKGIKGQLIMPNNEDSIRYIKENSEVFKGVCDRDFRFTEFDIYEATYNDEEVIGIDFNLLDFTSKEVEEAYKRFKKEIKNHFGFTPKEVLKLKYDLISGVGYNV